MGTVVLKVVLAAAISLGVLGAARAGPPTAGGGAPAPVLVHAVAASRHRRTSAPGPRVETRRLVMVDTTRPTRTVPGHSKASPVRRIPVLLVYPVHRHGRLPLVVFLHGINSSAAAYTPFLDALAGFGYVVAAPDSPETTGGSGLANVEDFTVLPGDARFVIGRIGAGAVGVPRGLVNTSEVAVAGHSFGGAGAYGIGFNTCCRDTRIAAVLSFEGALLPYPNGRFVWRGPPLLMVVGTRDPLIPLPTAQKTLASMQSPAYLLALAGANHTGGLEPGDVGHAELLTVVREFLAADLGHRATARAWLAREVRVRRSGLAGAHLGR